MRNASFLFFGVVLGVSLVFAGKVTAQIIENVFSDEKLFISSDPKTKGEALTASSTFSSLDGYEVVKAQIDSTHEITVRLDRIIKLLERR